MNNDDGGIVLLAILALPVVFIAGLVIVQRRGWFRAASSPLKTIAINAIFAGAGLSVLLAGAELYFRYVFDSTDQYGFSIANRRWSARHVQRNNHGFRDDVSYENKIAPGKRRITFVGDSFTAGHGIEVNERFANLIRRAHPEWEIQVRADFGIETDSETQLVRMAQQQNVDLDTVVLVYCLNDISDLLPDWIAEITRVSNQFNNIGYLLKHSFALNTLYFRSFAYLHPSIMNYFEVCKKAYAGDVWAKQKERLRGLRAAVQAAHARLLVVTFPFVHEHSTENPFAAAHAALNAFWKSESVPHLDLWPVLAPHIKEGLAVNRFDAHPSVKANALAAQAIDEFLVRNLEPRVDERRE